ncbi:MAG TPA: thiamine-phosphate kinase [Pyrinomonadaceae bacterium]|nr:thiamine-phosphate kinase [Pyrinomonadaceae bacterium]
MEDEKKQPITSGQSRSEFEFIDALRQRVGPAATQSLIAGIGDDAAVIRNTAGKETVITADLLVEDVDFRRTTTPPYLLGHKALAVSLSDIAAMGSRPQWSLISIGVPDDIWQTDFVDRLYEGVIDLANRYGVQLIGGDTSRTTENIVIDSIVTGECTAGMSVKRSGARAGDQIFVTGSLGAAAAGLRLIERGAHLAEQNLADEDSQKLDHVLLRQLRPEPRVGWGIVLGDEQLATAMIDLSDGLSSDLNHLCRASGVGARIDSALLPIDQRVAELCGRRALDPLQLALHGGEDFELLFTVKPANVARLPRRVDGVEIKRIGEVTSAPEGIKISEGSRVWDLKPGGWKHF